ncbi:DMT family transporter [Paenibacillus sp. NPDC056579]|uniref:DMT family transporter n=1 Tax=unclassified Paenibacillus TaxID=185978 RepID=UPI001EF8A7A9|nr:multidrug efflux SMR transporter [Paenibacillus sp. H1-7]ULL14534.1 QacE family quaternary ammonium compound efflux SMR transporter [Paenibacillus sp. H1-7]
MAWIILISAGLCEVAGVIAMKRVTVRRDGSSYLLMALAYIASFSLLTLAMTDISMGTSYAIWTGIGSVGSAAAGMIAFGEAKDYRRIACMALILVSVIGLKWIS